jgi:hypothetical protein
MLVTGAVAAVDTYNGLNCAGKTGGYIRIIPSAPPAAQSFADMALAVPYGFFRGIVYNFGQSLGSEGTCGASSYTAHFAGGISRLFNNTGAGKVYLVNQALLGAPGSALGGVVAEEVQAYNKLPPLHPRYP